MSEQEAPRISVLVPVFNGEGFLAKSIGSALNQSIQDLEVIVIDDASRDNTVGLVRDLMNKDRRLSLIESESNGGPGTARTLGLRAARGEWIAILDADDEMEDQRLETLIVTAERECLDAIADNLALLDPGLGKVVANAFPMAAGEWIDLTPERFLENVRPGARVNLGWMQPLVRRDFLSKFGIEWPDVRHAEDMVFTMRLLMAGARFRLIGDAQYIYTQRRGAKSGQASVASRTLRSTSEQHRALDLMLDDTIGPLSDRSRSRIDAMRSEIIATSKALDLRDAVSDANARAALKSLMGLAVCFPSFSRCLWTRYVVGNRLT